MADIQNIEATRELSFEDFKHQNGIIYWLATEYMQMLGYSDLKSFKKVLDRTTKALIALGIEHYENIIPIKDDKTGCVGDYKLTRFACYLAAMNADAKKPEVAQAQAYFAVQTRKFEVYIQNNNDLDRLLYRDEVTEGNKVLSSAAHNAGVVDYARFTNAGYRGMYNMLNVQLANKRGLDKSKLMETMGRTELAANLFRITQTEERIKSQNIHGQEMLEQTHYEVGKEVRDIVRQNTGRNPEDLPQERTLPEVKKELKKGFREMKKLDKK